MREDLEYVGLDAGTEGTAAAGHVVGIGLLQPLSLSLALLSG